MIRRPPRSTQSRSSAASDVYKRQHQQRPAGDSPILTRIWTPTRASVVPPTGAHPFYDPLRVKTLTKDNPVACFDAASGLFRPAPAAGYCPNLTLSGCPNLLSGLF